MSEMTDNLIQASVVYNPFEPSDRTDAFLEYQEGRTLAQYVEGLPEGVEWTVVLNGNIIPTAALGLTFPKPNDAIIATVVPEGGDDNGKSILALIATVALSVVAPIAGGAIANAMVGVGQTATALQVTLATTAVSIAGGLLISSFIPTPEVDLSSAEAEGSYGIDGPKNTSTEGVPYPILYGEHAFGGNIINLHTENATDDDGKSIQYVYGRVLVSEGPIDSIGQIFLNDQEVESYNDVEIDYRLGANSQTPSPWFEETVSLFNQGREMTTSWQTYTTSQKVDRLRLDVVAPQGIGQFDNKGNRQEITVGMEFEYSKAGQNQWQPFEGHKPWTERTTANAAQTSANWRVKGSVQSYSRNSTLSLNPFEKTGTEALVELEYSVKDQNTWVKHPDQKTVDPTEAEWSDVSWTLNDLPLAAYDFRLVVTSAAQTQQSRIDTVFFKGTPTTAITESKATTLRRSYFSEDSLDEDFYDVRYRRTEEPSEDGKVQDSLILSDVGEILNEKLALPYVAWVGYKALQTGQLNGIPKLSGVAKGRPVGIYDHRGALVDWRYSNNPADVALDVYFNERFGAGMSAERIDFAAFSEWRDFCTANGLEFNGLFYQGSNVDDALKTIFTSGRAQRISAGAKVSVAIDRPASPTMLFSHGNIRKNSFSITYLPFEDRVNDLELLFNDRSNRFRQKAVRVNDEASLARGAPLQSATVTLKGVTDEAVVLREGTFRMNANRLIKRTASWDSPIEAVGCTVGDVVTVQHEMMGWGIGGRLMPATTLLSAALDRSVHMTGGKQYRLLVLQNSKSVLSGVTVTSQTENLVTISAPLAEENPSAIALVNGDEYAITRKIDATTLVLEESARSVDLTAQASVDVRRYDVIDDVSVTNTVTAGQTVEIDTLDLESSLTIAEGNYPNYIFGEVQHINKLFRVKSISRAADGVMTLSAVEYVQEVYDDTPAKTPHVTSSLTETDHVKSLQVEEVIFPRGNSYVSKARVSWEASDDGVYGGALVQKSVNGSPFEDVQTVQGFDAYFEVESGDQITVRVIAIRHTNNQPMGAGAAPSAVLNATGVTANPTQPTGLTIDAGFDMLTANWVKVDDIDLRGYDIYVSATNSAPAAETAPTHFSATNSFTISGVLNGETRFVWVRSKDILDNVSDWLGPQSAAAKTVEIDKSPTAAPFQPALTANWTEEGRSIVEIDFPDVTGATGYIISVVKNGGTETVYPAPISYFELETSAGKGYVIKAAAVNEFGIASAWSPASSIVGAGDSVAPDTPLNPTVTAGFGQLWVKWDETAADDLSNYEIFVSDTSTTPSADPVGEILEASNAHLTYSGLGEGVTKHFFIRAIDLSGNRSGWSAVATGATRTVGDVSSVTNAINAQVDSAKTELRSEIDQANAVAALEGVSVLAEPASNWTHRGPEGEPSIIKPPSSVGTYVTGDPHFDLCYDFPNGDNRTIGQAAGFEYKQGHVYEVTYRFKAISDGDGGGVQPRYGVTTQRGAQMRQYNIQSMPGVSYKVADGVQEITVQFSSDAAFLTNAPFAAALSATSDDADRAYFYIRQYKNGTSNGILRVASITVRDVTEARSIKSTLTNDHYTAAQTDSAVALAKTELRSEMATAASVAPVDDFRDAASHWAHSWNYSVEEAKTAQSVVEAYPDVTVVSVAEEGEVLQGDGVYRVFSERVRRPFIEGQKIRVRIRTRLVQDPAPEAGNHRHRLYIVGVNSSGEYARFVSVRAWYSLSVADGWIVRETVFDPWQIRSTTSDSYFVDAVGWGLMPTLNGSDDNVGGAIQQIAWIKLEDVTDTEQLSADLEQNHYTAVETDAAVAAAETKLQAEIKDRSASVLASDFFAAGTFTNYSTGPVEQPNTVFSQGQSLHWNINDTAQGGVYWDSRNNNLWAGLTNASAYELEIVFELNSGSLNGAGVLLDWYDANLTQHRTFTELTDYVEPDGSVVLNKVYTARIVVNRPDLGDNGFSYNQMHLMANYDSLGLKAMKYIQFHKITVRPASGSHAKLTDLEATVATQDAANAIAHTNLEVGLNNVTALALDEIPGDFQDDGTFYSSSSSGEPTVQNPLHSAFTFHDDPDEGRFARVSDLSVNRYDNIFSKGYIKAVPGRTYRFTVRARYTGAPTGDLRFGMLFSSMDEALSFKSNLTTTSLAFTDQWADYTIERTWKVTDGPFFRARVYRRPEMKETGTVDFSRFIVEDVTDSVDLNGKIDEVKSLDANALDGSIFGTFLSQMNVAANGTVAGITNFGSAMAEMHGRASAAYVLRAKAGGSSADLELVAWSDATGGGSAIKLNADLIVASGTLSADALKANTALLGSITVDGQSLSSISANTDPYRYKSMRALYPAIAFGTSVVRWATHEPDTQIYANGELIVDAPSRASGFETVTQGAVIESNKPIGLTHDSSELASFAQAGTQFYDNWTRTASYTLFAYAPYADAEVTVKITGYTDVTFTVPAGTFVTHTDPQWAAWPGNRTINISSTAQVIVGRNTNGSDIYSLWPSDRNEWVTRSPRIVMNAGDVETESSSSVFAYVKLVDNHAAAVTEVGDGAGGDASFSVPVDALCNRYIFGHETNDFMIGAVEPCVIRVYQADGTLFNTYDFSAASKTSPLSYSEGSIAGVTTEPALFPAGLYFEGTAPFYVRSNVRSSQDEATPHGWREELRAEFDRSTFGSLAGNLARWASDPAARVNSGLTLIEPGKIVTDDLASLSANLGSVVINENLRIEDEAGFIYGRESRSDYEVPGFFLGSTKKVDGSRDFEVAHTHMDEHGRLSGVVHSEDAGFRVYNPKFLVQPPTSNPAVNSVKYTTSNTFSLGTGMKEVTVIAVGAGGAGGYGLEDGYHNTPAASGSNTAFWLYAGDPNAGGVLIEGPITALGGAGGENASSSASGYTGTAGGSTTFGAGGAAGSPQQAGTSAETTSYGAGGGGAGGDSPSTFDSSGGAGLGGQAGEEITTTVDLTAHLGTEIFIKTAIGSRGLASGGNYAGGSGAHGVVAVANPLAGHEEMDGHFLVDQTLEGLANTGRERTHVVMDTAELGPYSENRLFIIETVTSNNTSNDYRVRTIDATPRRIIVNMPGEIAYDSLLGNTVNQTLDGSFRNPTGTCWVFLEAGAIQSFDGGGRAMTWSNYREIIGVSEEMARRIIERIT